MNFLDLKWADIFQQFSRVRPIRPLISFHLQALRFFYGKQPVPLNYWLRCRSILKSFCRSPDPFFSARSATQMDCASLPVKDLADFLRDDLITGWTLDCETITFLWNLLQREQPKVIIECGAGLSTLVFARGLETYGLCSSNSSSVLSVEQNLWIKKAVETRLRRCGLERNVNVIHSAVTSRGEYQLNLDMLKAHLGSERADWIVIDGPAGPDGCRASTLPSLAPFCHPGTRWFLDDAYRDGELKVLNEWDRLGGIVVDGIAPIGKGLGMGIVNDPEQVPSCSKPSSTEFSGKVAVN